MESTYNLALCMSIKAKGCSLQCQHPKKNGSDYCGIHLKAKKIIRVDNIINAALQSNAQIQNVELDNQINKNRYNIFKKQIILIQKTFRMWNIYRRNRSNNKEDCGTLDSIFTIPIEYYFDYKDSDGFVYAFDLRTFDLLNMNPYNQKPLPEDEKTKNKLCEKYEFLKKCDKKIKYDSPKLSEEQKYDQNLIRIFQKYDMIGQYTDTNWFNNLSLDELKKFYKSCFDMFDYRSQLSMDIRKKITKDGFMFNRVINEVHYFRPKHKRILQMELLKEMERIVDEGEDREYKTLGINLVLSALVEVSYPAALALPHLVQSTFN